MARIKEQERRGIKQKRKWPRQKDTNREKRKWWRGKNYIFKPMKRNWCEDRSGRFIKACYQRSISCVRFFSCDANPLCEQYLHRLIQISPKGLWRTIRNMKLKLLAVPWVRKSLSLTQESHASCQHPWNCVRLTCQLVHKVKSQTLYNSWKHPNINSWSMQWFSDDGKLENEAKNHTIWQQICKNKNRL